MTCPNCGGTDISSTTCYPESDFETWSTWRSSIPFTGLIAIALKRLFSKKVPAYTCNSCGVTAPKEVWPK